MKRNIKIQTWASYTLHNLKIKLGFNDYNGTMGYLMFCKDKLGELLNSEDGADPDLITKLWYKNLYKPELNHDFFGKKIRRKIKNK